MIGNAISSLTCRVTIIVIFIVMSSVMCDG